MNHKIHYSLLHVTNRCNLSCKTCRVPSKSKHLVDPPKSFLIDAIDQLSLMNASKVIFTGGEPFLRDDIMSLISYASMRSLTTKIQTNGSLADESTIKTLSSFAQNTIGLSIDGYKKTHDKIRGMPRLYNHVIELARASKKFNLRVEVEYVVSKLNIEDFYMVANDLDAIGVDKLSVRSAVPTKCATCDHEHLLSPKMYYDFLRKISSLKLGMKNLHISSPDPLYYAYTLSNKELAQYIPNSGTSIAGCAICFGHISIQPNGDVLYCPMIYDPIGNLHCDRLEVIYKRYQESSLVKNFNLRKLAGACGDCNKRFLCGGCRARAEYYSKDILGEDCHCFFTKIDG